jgi:phosphoglycolate phosphatase-like HAD superfamily hydrolase
MRIIKLFLLSLFCGNILTATNIVFDLHGVLINISHTACMRELPLTTVAHYLALDAPSLRGIKKDLFAFLDLLDDQKPVADTYDPAGTKTPNIMTNNLTSLRSCAEVCSRAEYLCSTDNSYFRSAAHRNFMLGLTHAIFTPSLFVHSISWFNDMVDLAIEYKRLGHKVFLLSNLNDEHFAALKAQYPFHIAFFDGVVISGLVGLAKPDRAIYDYLLTAYKLDPIDTIFIDDQAVNCTTAQECGIASIVCPQKHSWLNLWSAQPDVEQTRRLIDLMLYRLAEPLS